MSETPPRGTPPRGILTSRPRDVAFKPERVTISQARVGDGAPPSAADWIVNSIYIGNVAMPPLTWWQRLRYRVRNAVRNELYRIAPARVKRWMTKRLRARTRLI